MSQSRDTAEATSFAEAMENLDLKTPQQGEALRGTIVSISGDDAYISYGGQGTVANASKPGWLYRFFNSPKTPF